MSSKYLSKNKTDLIVSSLKSVIGTLPVTGSFLSELVDNIIPNQRIDRLCKYVLELEHKFSTINKEKIIEALKSDECIDLFEEGFIQASRAITDDKRRYIANVVGNGIDDETIEFIESKYILKLLQELNEQEVIWLRYYMEPLAGGDKGFRTKHKNILEPIVATTGSDERTKERKSIQDSYKEHLERLGLIRPHYHIDRNTNIPEFDKFSGKPRVSFRDLTSLGRLVLKQIEIYKANENS